MLTLLCFSDFKMDKYYYLTAELPYLKFGHPPSINQSNFLKEANKWLSQKDFLILLEAGKIKFRIKKIYSLVLKRYIKFECNLRSELQSFREARQNNKEYKLSGKLRRIISLTNPLEVERALLRYRWNYLEEIEKGHYFDLDFLITFYLKLQILDRLFTFNKEKGLEKFDKLSQMNL